MYHLLLLLHQERPWPPRGMVLEPDWKAPLPPCPPPRPRSRNPPPPPLRAMLTIASRSCPTGCPASDRMFTSSRAFLAFAAVKKENDIPFAPALPVRPIRCT
eukprot:TRINITY_DN2099_c0_g1_i4.p1 TRINITY_DN2099_c0_g1~~TRINITY_DN2099_c0_g1_i4.p1  ORF type:complete len:102 (+),score=12.61 TRINITY_DN2099_c0_g1_i4:193-498(+)